MRPVDFEANPEQAGLEINHWVEQKTNDKIKNLIAPHSLSQTVRFILVNAIYLKAAWSAPFYEKNTTQRPFHIDATKDISVPTMNGGDFNGGMENDDLQALELGYAQSQLA